MVSMSEIKCGNCVKFKTQYCPCSIDCMATDDYLYFQNKRMLLEENQQLKEQLHESSIKIQELIEQDISCPTSCKKLQQRDEVIEEAIHELQKGIQFCKNDSQGFYDICNIAVTREQKVLDILNKYKNKDEVEE